MQRLQYLLLSAVLLLAGCGPKAESNSETSDSKKSVLQFKVHSVKPPKDNKYTFGKHGFISEGDKVLVVVDPPYDKELLRNTLENVWFRHKQVLEWDEKKKDVAMKPNRQLQMVILFKSEADIEEATKGDGSVLAAKRHLCFKSRFEGSAFTRFNDKLLTSESGLPPGTVHANGL